VAGGVPGELTISSRVAEVTRDESASADSRKPSSDRSGTGTTVPPASSIIGR
jgi:hypothetical protein